MLLKRSNTSLHNFTMVLVRQVLVVELIVRAAGIAGANLASGEAIPWFVVQNRITLRTPDGSIVE